MSSRIRLLAPLAALSILVAGCAATDAATQPTARTPAAPHASKSPGQSMPGMTMPGTGTGPSQTAAMVCGAEIRGDVTRVSAVRTPAGTSTWADRLFTCTYRLPVGPLTLTVKDSPDLASGRTYFDALRQRLGQPQALSGVLSLGFPSFQTRDGNVVFLKDGKTLQVDATRLPAAVGPYHQSRADLAYGVASAVVACWSE